MGGEQPAARFMQEALAHGKHVITANKVALALNWDKLQAQAEESHVGLWYEASVGGVIPVIRVLNVNLESDRIDRIYGIINGTTNYILTRMAQEGKDYDEVLRDAQRLGLAEPNPATDVEGMDAAYKLSILASLAFHGLRSAVFPEDGAAARILSLARTMTAIPDESMKLRADRSSTQSRGRYSSISSPIVSAV